MDLQNYTELLSETPTTKGELIKHFENKINFFLSENNFEDGPGLYELLEEMITCFQQLDKAKVEAEDKDFLAETITDRLTDTFGYVDAKYKYKMFEAILHCL